MKKTKKMNNKGFSLVELIIVVAIMAVLVGVLAPQYMKYVERSRESADLDNYNAIISAVQIYYSDPNNSLSDGDYTLAVSGSLPASPADAFKKPIEDAGLKTASIVMKSEKYKAATLKLTKGSGKYTFTTTNTNLASALGIGSYTATP